ncbi:MAG TPA: S41 family peptidase, partial [Usitatibacter sp.]|nr:S41 family peptidase [Usitatibacter sp.]
AAVLAAAMPVLAQAPSEAQLDAAMAFARTYGVVRYFHPSDSLDRVDWNRFLVHGSERMASLADRASLGAQLEALYAPIVDSFKIVPRGTPAPAVAGDGPLVEWRHLGYGMEPTPRNQPYVSWRTHHDPLHDGKIKGPYFQHEAAAAQVKADPPIVRVPVGDDAEALVPVSMPMSATKAGEAQAARLEALAKTLEPVAVGGDTASRAQAWADGIAAWNVARHFYPYWSVLRIDWEAWLRKWLAAQPASQSREQLRIELRRLIAPLDDGHGDIIDTESRQRRQLLPISVRPLGDKWVVEASLVPERVKPGDVIVGVNGRPAEAYFREAMAIESGSPQFVRWRAARELCFGPAGNQVALRLERAGKVVNEKLAYDHGKIVVMPRPDAISEVRPGIWYVDLSRFQRPAFDLVRDRMAAARAIVFDLRGYPSPDAVGIAPYWLTGADTAQWMIVPRFDVPFAQSTTGWSIGWQLDREAALAKPAKVLLTDGRAISYAESLVGYFAGQKTGRILGEATGGVNGNVVAASLPSGMRYIFTGMRVTRHDGTLMHREGFAPDEVVTPTPAGLAAGKDEALERALYEVERP